MRSERSVLFSFVVATCDGSCYTSAGAKSKLGRGWKTVEGTLRPEDGRGGKERKKKEERNKKRKKKGGEERKNICGGRA